MFKQSGGHVKVVNVPSLSTFSCLLFFFFFLFATVSSVSSGESHVTAFFIFATFPARLHFKFQLKYT